MKKIGFIGTGVMGSSMVKHLLNAGYPVTVYNRTKEKAETVINAGATWANTPKEVSDTEKIANLEKVIAKAQDEIQKIKYKSLSVVKTGTEN